MTQPQIWHYGLVARDWVEFITDGGPEVPYFRRMIETYGQPALDLGVAQEDYCFPTSRLAWMWMAVITLGICLPNARNALHAKGLHPGFISRPSTSWICRAGIERSLRAACSDWAETGE